MNKKVQLPPAWEALKEKFMQTEDLVLMDGTQVTPEEMWDYACLPFTGKFGDLIDHRADLELLSVIRHKYLIFSCKDRTVKMREKSVPSVLFGDLILRLPAREITYGCRGTTTAITIFLSEISWNRTWSHIKKVAEWCSFEACPAEPTIALMGEDGVIPADLIMWACGELSCTSQMIRKWPIPLHFFDVPFNGKGKEWAVDYLTDQIRAVVDKLSRISGREVTTEDLNNGIRMMQDFHDSYREYFELVATADIPPIASTEDLLVKICVFDCCGDPVALASANRSLVKELRERVRKGVSAPGISKNPVRIYLCQRGLPVHGVEYLESLGATVMGSETLDVCSMFDDPIETDTDDPCRSLAEWTLNKQPWSMGRPLEDRAKWLLGVLEKCRPEGVIFTSAWGCQLDTQINRYMAEEIRKKFDIPLIMLDKEFASVEVNEDDKLCLTASLRTRLEGFMELLKARRMKKAKRKGPE